jgi:ABC-type multidrug transport system fused ATPase/permease subunit
MNPARTAAATGTEGPGGGLSLSVEGVDLRFGGIHALRSVSFEAEPGQITAIIGPNGAGKTSVFNTISGFYRPAAGRIRLGAEDKGGEGCLPGRSGGLAPCSCRSAI